MHQQHSLNHISSAAAESRDGANINHSQEAPISRSQPGVEKRWAAEPDVVGTGEFTERSCLSLFASCVYVSELLSAGFYWRGPCYVEHEYT